MNAINVKCSRRRCGEPRLVSAATGRNGKPYCLDHLPRQRNVVMGRRLHAIAALDGMDRLRAERFKVLPQGVNAGVIGGLDSLVGLTETVVAEPWGLA